ncbi:MAG: hypothetical protein ACLQFR_21690 [Streptosporangiaceae bacterium]
MSDEGLEAPDADVAEQEMDALPGDADADQRNLPDEVPLEANEADAVEQALLVNLDDDDHDR